MDKERKLKLAALEALLFAAGEPLSVSRLAELMELERPALWQLLEELKEIYALPERGLMLREVAEGIQLVTKPDYFPLLSRLGKNKEVRLSNAALETLAIVAYKQPVTRSEMEDIRGVSVDGVVNTLLDLGLICEAGRKQALGKPLLYATTAKFLEIFGLKDLASLPGLESIRENIRPEEEAVSLFGAEED